jgi:hypothetical protein
VERFRQDAERARSRLGERDLTLDYGFNGSPLYAFARRLDPTLHRPFGPEAGLVNLIVQTLAALLVAWLAGLALGLAAEERLAAGALLFASWDFTGYALAGLTFAEIWLPAAIVLLAWRRGHPALAGVAAAWAGLMKLFPLMMILPALAGLARRVGPRHAAARPDDARAEADARMSLRFLLAWLASMAALGLLALLSGRSWGDFLHKVGVQFQSRSYLMNSVGLSQLLLTLGVHDSVLPVVLFGTAACVLVALSLRRDSTEESDPAPRRMLVLLAGAGLVAHTWFNYYALAPLLLLPLLARRHPRSACACACALAAGFILPDFDGPALREAPFLHLAKVVPYVVIPAGLIPDFAGFEPTVAVRGSV